MKNVKSNSKLVDELVKYITKIISETNGITLEDTIELLISCPEKNISKQAIKSVNEFRDLLFSFKVRKVEVDELIVHPLAKALFIFFQNFPLRYKEEHIHLTGSLTAEFIYPRLKKLLAGPNKETIKKKIIDVYGKKSLPIKSPADVEKMIRIQKKDGFNRYLEMLMLPKLILTTKKAHTQAAYHLATELYKKYNIGNIRIKFTLSRNNNTGGNSEEIPGIEKLTPEDVVLGLYDGFNKFKKENTDFNFVLSPSFRKEIDYFDSETYSSKEEDIKNQVDIILNILKKYPKLTPHLSEIDTVGNEKHFFRKKHFLKMKNSFRKLQYKGFHIRSHHGETWMTLRRGIQAVDNAMNIWHIDTLEHGLSLGINPNYYFHSLYQQILQQNENKIPIKEGSLSYNELVEMEWNQDVPILEKLLAGKKLNKKEVVAFTKAKFHTAREIEHYQHDVLNRMINKNVALVALPSSNFKLTHSLIGYKDHPFSWWEKKGVQLGVGTDNYVTLNTNFISEMLILLFTDPDNLKITKLLMITTGEEKRPYLSSLLWDMRKNYID